MSSKTLCPMDGPRFNSCSATKCPFDSEVHARIYMPGDRVCFYIQLDAKELLTPENRYGLSGEQMETVGKYAEYLNTPMSHSEKGLWELKLQLSKIEQTPIREVRLPVSAYMTIDLNWHLSCTDHSDVRTTSLLFLGAQIHSAAGESYTVIRNILRVNGSGARRFQSAPAQRRVSSQVRSRHNGL